MIRRPPRSTLDRSSAASDVYKRQVVPLFTPELVSVVKRILQTDVFVDLFCFCVFRNPHLSDKAAHLAALIFLHIQFKILKKLRWPDLSRDVLKCIRATASVYANWEIFQSYKNLLLKDPESAVSGSYYSEYDGFKVKRFFSENLGKTIFFLDYD